MNATNHMAVGAIIAITVKEPLLVMPLAFASHFVLDSLPHFGYKEDGFAEYFKHRLAKFAVLLDVLGVTVLLLVISPNWLVYVAMILSVSPDFIWFIRYFLFEKKGVFKPGERMDPMSKLHAKVQWFERPIGFYLEVILSVILASVVYKIS